MLELDSASGCRVSTALREEALLRLTLGCDV